MVIILAHLVGMGAGNASGASSTPQSLPTTHAGR